MIATRFFVWALSLVLLSTIPASAGAQTFKQWMALGEESFAAGDYLQAALYYGEAYTLDSTSFETTIRYADALRLSRDYLEARRLYEKAYDKDKGRLYPEGQYYLGQMQMLNEEYSQALRNFKKYEKQLKRQKESVAYQRLLQEMQGCSLALAARMPDSDISVTAIEGSVNTEKSEFGGFINDGLLYYTASEAQSAAISQRVADFDSSGFSNARLMDGLWSSTSNHGNLTISPDKSRAYFVECENGRCRIYECDYDHGVLSNKRSIPTVNQSEVTSTMPFVGMHRGKEVLFFASDRPGTRGGLDIWWSFRSGNGEWEPPVNAGDNVNTPGNEITPYYSGEHLYFSSDWHPGFGGFDVFRSKGYPRSFDLPENMDRPINSSLNDLYYRYFPENEIALLASNREGSLRDGSFCCNDLYQISIEDSLRKDEVPDVFTSLKQLNDYLPVTLYFHNDEPNPRTRDTTTTVSYEDSYKSYLGLKSQYSKEMAKGLKNEDREDAEFEVDEFFSFFVDKGMRNLEIFSELLLEELEKGYSIQLTIKGYASPRAKSDYNVNLTSRRIHSLINYMNGALEGAFLPYIEGRAENHATLSFERIPFGEYRADLTVSDDLTDRQSSVYSRGARMERKIEILSVQRGLPDSLFAMADFNMRVIDFGQIASDREVERSIQITSVGTDSLHIDSILVSCGCTVPELEQNVLAPGQSTFLDVSFNPEGMVGIVTRKLLVYARTREEPYEITIAAEVVPEENED